MMGSMKVTIVAGIFIVIAAFVNGGRYISIPSSQAAWIVVVDRFTGEAYVNDVVDGARSRHGGAIG